MTSAQEAAFRLACALPSRRHEWKPKVIAIGSPEDIARRAKARDLRVIVYKGRKYRGYRDMRARLHIASTTVQKLLASGEARRGS